MAESQDPQADLAASKIGAIHRDVGPWGSVPRTPPPQSSECRDKAAGCQDQACGVCVPMDPQCLVYWFSVSILWWRTWPAELGFWHPSLIAQDVKGYCGESSQEEIQVSAIKVASQRN